MLFKTKSLTRVDGQLTTIYYTTYRQTDLDLGLVCFISHTGCLWYKHQGTVVTDHIVPLSFFKSSIWIIKTTANCQIGSLTPADSTSSTIGEPLKSTYTRSNTAVRYAIGWSFLIPLFSQNQIAHPLTWRRFSQHKK